MPWRSPHPSATVRLFCLPYAGGAAATYRPWARLLPPSIELCPVEIPGRGTRMRAPLAEHLDDVVDDLLAAVTLLDDLPFVLFGHSMGALIGLAATLRLEGGRSEPSGLIVSAALPPSSDPPRRRMSDLSDDQFVAKIAQLDGTPREVLEHQELMALMLPILRADLALVEGKTWDPNATVGVPIEALGGSDDPSVPADRLAGWSRLTTGAFNHRVFPGGHFYLSSSHETEVVSHVARRVLEMRSPSPATSS